MKTQFKEIVFKEWDNEDKTINITFEEPNDFKAAVRLLEMFVRECDERDIDILEYLKDDEDE